MRPIKTLLLRVIAIAVAFTFGLQAQEIKQGGYRSAQLKVTAGGAGWDFDTGNLIQLVLTDARGIAEFSGEYLTVGNDSSMPIKVSSKRVGIQNVEIGPGEQRRFKIQGYRRPNSQYYKFNSSVPVGIVYWSGPSPQETQQAIQAKAQKDSDARAGKERKAQEAQRAREAEEQAKKDEWTRNAQKQQDEQAARARAAAEESRRQWGLSQQRAKAQRDGIAALGQMVNQAFTDRAIRTQQEQIRSNLKALENGTLVRCNNCGGSGFAECEKCGGEGVEECSLCSGRGEVGYGQFANKCTMCGGGGKSSCSTCQGTGRVDCSMCKGTGQLGPIKTRASSVNIDSASAGSVPALLPRQLIKIVEEKQEDDPSGQASTGTFLIKILENGKPTLATNPGVVKVILKGSSQVWSKTISFYEHKNAFIQPFLRIGEYEIEVTGPYGTQKFQSKIQGKKVTVLILDSIKLEQ